MIYNEIAVVTIGRNEGERLVKCLKSIPSNVFRTVYVDSGSTDGSCEVAERLAAHVVKLQPIQPFTAARARNEGVAIAKNLWPDIKLIQFIDGDCELAEGWLAKATNFLCDRSDVAMVCGRRRELYPSASIYNLLCDFEWDTPIGEAVACGGDSLVRAIAIDAVGGFRAQLIAGEEPELCLRLRERGWKIWRLDAEMTRHDAGMTRFKQWWRRTVRCGYGITEVTVLHRHTPLTMWKGALMRTIFWGGLLPTMLVIGAFIHPVALVGLLIYPIQICRIGIRRGASSSASWEYAAFVTLAKFAEMEGALKFFWSRTRRQSTELIEYK